MKQLTHANIQKAKNLMSDMLCVSSRMGKYCVTLSFFGSTESLLVDIYQNTGDASRLFKTYHFGLDDPDFEEKANLCTREVNMMARALFWED